MAAPALAESLANATCEEFTASLLHLYSGSTVKVRIGCPVNEFVLSRALLCTQSPYFAATFAGNSREGAQQATTVKLVEGIVSVRSFKMLIQWLYLGRVKLGNSNPRESITAIVEFVRLADMYAVTGMESLMATHIKSIIRGNFGSYDNGWGDFEADVSCITAEHIKSGVMLPVGHPVRVMFATASVGPYLRHEACEYLEESRQNPDFSMDLLKELDLTVETFKTSLNIPVTEFIDPLTNETSILC